MIDSTALMRNDERIWQSLFERGYVECYGNKICGTFTAVVRFKSCALIYNNMYKNSCFCNFYCDSLNHCCKAINPLFFSRNLSLVILIRRILIEISTLRN